MQCLLSETFFGIYCLISAVKPGVFIRTVVCPWDDRTEDGITDLPPLHAHSPLIEQECLHQRAGQDLDPFADLVQICSSASCLNGRILSHHVSIFTRTSSRPMYPQVARHHTQKPVIIYNPNQTLTPKKTKQKPKHHHPDTSKKRREEISTMGRVRTCDHPCSAGPPMIIGTTLVWK